MIELDFNFVVLIDQYTGSVHRGTNKTGEGRGISARILQPLMESVLSNKRDSAVKLF